jgi:hypothetical protein
MKNGKRKLGYGGTADEAYENLKLRLSQKEVDLIVRDQVERIAQRDLQKHVRELG